MEEQVERHSFACYSFRISEEDLRKIEQSPIEYDVDRIYNRRRTIETITLGMERDSCDKYRGKKYICLNSEQFDQLRKKGFVTFEDGLGDVVITMR